MERQFKNIPEKSPQRGRFSTLICAAAITLILGATAGCTVRKLVPAETQSSNEASGEMVPAQTQEAETTAPENTKNPEETLSADGQKIKSAAEEFAAAYFSGDMDTVQSYLVTPYEPGEPEVYTGADSISEFTIKGLTDIGEEEIGSAVTVSLEYRDSDDADTLRYLTLEFVKQEDGWRIQFYGLEG